MSKHFLLKTKECLTGCVNLHNKVKDGHHFKTIATTLAIAAIGITNPSFATNNPEIQPVIQQATTQVQNYQQAWDGSVEEVKGENPFLTFQQVFDDFKMGKYDSAKDNPAEKQFLLENYDNYRFKTLLTNAYTPAEFKERLLTFVKGHNELANDYHQLNFDKATGAKDKNNVLMENLVSKIEQLPENDAIFDVMGKTFSSKSDPTLHFSLLELTPYFASDMASKIDNSIQNNKSGIDLLVKVVSAVSTGGVSLLLGDANPLSLLSTGYLATAISEQAEYDSFGQSHSFYGALPDKYNIYQPSTASSLNNMAGKLNIPGMAINMAINAASSTEQNPPDETQALVSEQAEQPNIEHSLFSTNRAELNNKLTTLNGEKESINQNTNPEQTTFSPKMN